ncbi:phage tail sheath C-terminal domain-containing protein [Agrilactobacillus fermenti]|uniref:phage tail sheath C-terminal domain-containing protein n=1 Tax=Agrilactobacillus fermenti TaxID=2586909 RepID=UPI003A5C64CF
MAGGTWTTMNKRRPGAYINTVGQKQPKPDTSLGRTLLIGHAQLGWGADGVIELDANSNFKALLGTTLEDSNLVALRETLKGALTVLFYNQNKGKKATLDEPTLPWVFAAKYAGTKGNDLHVSFEKDPNEQDKITVTTLFNTEIVDQQVIRTTTAAGLVSNDYLDVQLKDTKPTEDKKDGNQALLEALAATITVNLTGGTNEAGDVTAGLNGVLETQNYNVVTAAGYPADSNIHVLVAMAVERLRETEGYKIRGVVPALEGATNYDYEGISVIANGVELEDGTKISTTDAAGFFAGVSSAAGPTQSLTYAAYPGAVKANPALTNELTVRALNAGEIVFTGKRDNRVVIEQDINSLTKFTDDKPQQFSKNRVIRVLDTIAINTSEVFENQFLGKVNNDPTGRDLFKANRVAYMASLQASGIVQDYDAADITVDPGPDKDTIVVTLAVTPIDSMEKLYMTIVVR